MTLLYVLRAKLVTHKFPWWLPILVVAIIWRMVVLASGAVSFASDEAIIGLMARHINQGQPIPVFFYGQPYMGSLDSLLVALAFRVLGESVLNIRIVQSMLYLALVGTTMLLALRLSRSRQIAAVAGLMLALPPTVVTLYTTVSLGGYGETLVLGNLLLLVGYEIRQRQNNQDIIGSSWRYWLALGALTGLGWWTNSLIIVYIIPVGLLLLRGNWRRWKMLSVALMAFIVGSAPWWVYNLTHDWESVRFLLGGFQGNGGPLDRLVGFLFLGLPALMGLRFPWSLDLWSSLLAVPVIAIYIVLLVASLYRKAFSSALALLWIMLIAFTAIFVATSFGVDSTGRYLLPILVPVAILIGTQTTGKYRSLAKGAIALLLAANLVGTVMGIRTVPPGLTPQFDSATDFTNDFDQQVISFLEEHGGNYGYATYWVTYRLAFLSHEAITLSPQLPYKASLLYTDTERYSAYTRVVDSAAHSVLINANLPQLDRVIVEMLKAHGVTFLQQAIGPYTIFYDLSEKVTPGDLGLQNLAPNS